MKIQKVQEASLVLVNVHSSSSFGAEKLKEKFEKAFGESIPPLHVSTLENLAALAETYEKKVFPHVFIFHASKEVVELSHSPEHRELSRAIESLRWLDPGLCLLILTDGLSSSKELMHWLDLGATGLLNLDFGPQQVSDALKESLQRRLNLHLPRTPRINTHHKVTLNFSTLEQAVVAEMLNIGHGGMFVREVPQNALPGDTLDFEFLMARNQLGGKSYDTSYEENAMLRALDSADSRESESLNSGKITGSGTIVWVRPRAASGLPEGIGVQFSQLNPEGQHLIEKFISSHRAKAFIPKM